MAPSSPVSYWQDPPEPDSDGDWQALRSNLISLLDQVEGHKRRQAEPVPATAPAKPKRVPADRRQEALRSVRSAVERFSETESAVSHDAPYADDAPLPSHRAASGKPAHAPKPHEHDLSQGQLNPQDQLQAAIAQIRAQVHRPALRAEMAEERPYPHAHNDETDAAAAFARTAPHAPDDGFGRERAAYRAREVDEAPRNAHQFRELGEAIAAIGTRLETLEGEVKRASRTGGDVSEIAAQVSQLADVVEMLAGAVGETGQVKRLEAQIAGLAEAIAEGPSPAISALSRRIDEIAATAERLTELQVQSLGRVSREQAEAHAASAAALDKIETSVRAVYDRIDVLEERTALAPQDLDRLLREVSEIAKMLKGWPDTTAETVLLPRIDALDSRLSALSESAGGPAMADLKAEVTGLKTAVLQTVEPRFDALQTELKSLGDTLSANATPTSLARIEGQIRQLTARIDETGEQLEHLTTLYQDQPAPEAPPAPDYEELARLVAQRTSEEIARNTAIRSGLNEESLAKIEDRLSQFFAGQKDQKTPDVLTDVHKGIGVVEEKLARLEAALGKRMSEPAPQPAPAPARSAEPSAEKPSQPQPKPQPASQAKSVQSSVAPQPSIAQAKLMKALAPEPEWPMLEETIDPVAAEDDVPHGPSGRRGPKIKSIAADTMPHAPSADTPLRDPGFGPDPVASVSAEPAPTAEPGKRAGRDLRATLADLPPLGGPQATHTPEAPAEITESAAPEQPSARAGLDPRTFDPNQTVRPEKPRSSFEDARPASYLDDKKTDRMPPAEAGADRDTFIAAARRSVLRAEQAQEEAQEHSLFKRAAKSLTRARPKKADAKPAETEARADIAVPTQEDEHTRPGTAAILGGMIVRRIKASTKRSDEAAIDAEPEAAEAPAEAKAPEETPKPRFRRAKARADQDVLPAAPEPQAQWASTDMEIDDTPPVTRARGFGGAGFLGRNRRILLLSAALVAVSLLAANLAVHRMKAPSPGASAVPASTAPAAGASSNATGSNAAPPRTVAPATGGNPASATTPSKALLDPSPTGSVDPQMSIAMPNRLDMTQPMPQVVGLLDGGTTANAGSSTNPAPAGNAAATSAMTTGSISTPPSADANAQDSAVRLAMPPKQVGPMALRQAAADGDPRAQFEVGAIYTEGTLVPKDLNQAEIWYERSAAQGFAPAQYRLGNLYEHGEGVKKDLEQAKLWYQRSAEAGNRMAMHNLASLLASGALGSQQFPAAAEWFAQAAARGMTDSQFNLGMLYARGLGVKQDPVTSYKWFALAAMDGDKDAAKARDDMARSLDPTAMAKARAEVDAWRVAPINMQANYAPIGTWAKNFDPGAPITDKNVIKRVQIALSRIGYELGTPDGVMGPKTTDAIKNFETATGMSPSGVVNPRLLAVLGSQPV